jgi:hypothetical protein
MWGMNELLGTIVVERRRDAPVGVSNNVEEFCEVVHNFNPTWCGENMLGEMKYVLNMAPRTLDRVRMRPSTLIDGTDRMVQSLVYLAMST